MDTKDSSDAFPARVDVHSSLIKSVGHSDDVLEVELASGAVYRYYGVSVDVAKALVESPSPGRYFQANIRDGYTHEKVG